MSTAADDPGSRRLRWTELPRQSPVTALITAVCVLAFGVTLAVVLARSDSPVDAMVRSLWTIDDDTALRSVGALDLTRIWIDGEWWRVLTTAGLHGSWIHLGLNLTALWSVGTWLERGLGSARSGLVFLVAALGGSLASLAACEAPTVVGASAGILGMAGALLVARRWGSESVRREIAEVSSTSLAVMIGLCIGLGVVVPVIAQAGHLGGLALGTCTAFAVIARDRWSVRAISAACAVALLVAGVAVGREPIGRSKYPLFLAFRHLDDGDTARALESFEEALAAEPGDASLANAVAYHLSLAGKELDRAEALAQRALAVEPENPDFLDTMGWIECRRGRTEAGLEWLRRASSAAEGQIAEIEEHLRACGESAVVPGG